MGLTKKLTFNDQLTHWDTEFYNEFKKIYPQANIKQVEYSTENGQPYDFIINGRSVELKTCPHITNYAENGGYNIYIECNKLHGEHSGLKLSRNNGTDLFAIWSTELHIVWLLNPSDLLEAIYDSDDTRYTIKTSGSYREQNSGYIVNSKFLTKVCNTIKL